MISKLPHGLWFIIYQEGRVAPDNAIGRFISDAVATLPKISPPDFDKLMNASIEVNSRNNSKFNCNTLYVHVCVLVPSE